VDGAAGECYRLSQPEAGMKHAIRVVFGMVCVAALCSCESLPTTDLYERASYLSPQNQAYSNSHSAFRSAVGQGQSNFGKMNDVYSATW
jgi:hypothetical protein